MPITSSNWENFFQGAFAEHHVSSLFYFYGYEAHKASPDVGIDWLITNVARGRFFDEERLNAEVQVKSALLDQSGAFVAMDADEVDFLSEGEHRYTVFVLLSELSGRTDPGSYERGDDPDASRAVDRDHMQYREMLASIEGRKLRRDGNLSIYEFNGAKLTLFWLHSAQIKRLKAGKTFVEMDTGRLGLPITVADESVSIAGIPLIPELHDLTYIVKSCSAGLRIRQGHMSMSDY
ncbi:MULTISPECIES: hypothetical protein [unclassified Janthinobacterium]|uniref:hypothetical protein n=1 Tax=unclassified Janthinobacterium TaxID=2610881 RepID=UPI0008886486|nr:MULTISPECIES: hypothetical protein [unclassified Janthinobacterium]SDA53968.1 hypothetical protein SAMN03159349_01657 [Janthinobacterium sp. 551a]SFB45330.1 hypothetical protein SAMN03159300_10510 [Janthinobacterium sp. 344]